MVMQPYSSRFLHWQEQIQQRTGDISRQMAVAIVVTYLPAKVALDDLLRNLTKQCVGVVVVDNTPSGEVAAAALLEQLAQPRVLFKRVGENVGIATALNIGIRIANEAGASHVLLSDQDSLPGDAMVAGLLQTLVELEQAGEKVGSVAPVFVDRHTGISFPFQARVPGKFFYGHVRPDARTTVVEALTLITSGTLIPVSVLDDVGLMREDLFIDHVDIEWCHRARSRGWKLFGTSNASMLHSMGGEESLRVWYFGWRQESAYSPLRMYYRIRNFVVLCGLDYIDVRWKIRNGWYWLGFLYSHVVFGRTKFASLRMAWMGLVDGLRGRLGPHRAIR